MFLLYAVVLGVVVGRLGGGSLETLGQTRFRWAGLALAGLVGQVALFADPVAARLEGSALGPALYVASVVAVLAAVVANRRIPGIALVFLGAVLNLVAIVANGGYMPADPAALAAAGRSVGPGYSNSVVTAGAALRPLTDILALPAWLPLANVFSVGDVLIGIGVAVAIAVSMRRPTPAPDAPAGEAIRPRVG